MRNSEILKRAWKNIVKERIRLLMSFLFLLLTFLTLGASRMFFAAQTWGMKECENVLARGIDGTGTLRLVNFPPNADEELFLERAIDSEIIEAIGNFSGTLGKSGTDILPELTKIQHTFPNMDPSYRYLQMCSTTRWALGLCKLQFRERAEVPEEKWSDHNWTGLYLGSSFRDVPLGTVYRYETYDGTVREYEVIGLLERDQRLLNLMVFYHCDEAGYASSKLLDDLVLFVAGSHKGAWLSGSCGYIPAEGVSLEEAENYLKDLADELEVPIEFEKMKDGFQKTKLEDEMITRILKKLSFVLVACCFLINAGTLILQFQARKKEFGILYAFGCSERDICKIFLAENGIKMALAFLISFCGIYSVAQQFFTTDENATWVLGYVMRTDLLPYMLLVAIAFTMIFALIPITMLLQARPAGLMKESRG